MLTRRSRRTSRPDSSRASRIAALVQLPRRDRRSRRETPTVRSPARSRAAPARAASRRRDDRADRDLRIEVEHEPARAADQPVRVASLQAALLERAAAGGAEAVLHNMKYYAHVDPEGRADGASGAPRPRQTARSGRDQVAARSSSSSTTCSRRCRNTRASGSPRRRSTRACGCSSPGFPPRRDEDDDDEDDEDGDVPLMALINPEITIVGDETVDDWEGCLSIPDIRGRVTRARDIEVKAYDRTRAADRDARARLHGARHPARDRSPRRRAVLRSDGVARDADVPRRVRPYWNRRNRDVPEE